jgi:hypothetical protein
MTPPDRRPIPARLQGASAVPIDRPPPTEALDGPPSPVDEALLPIARILAPALRRHLQDLPWRADRLALTERQMLRAVGAGATTLEAVMHAQHAEDPVFPQTDLMVLDLYRRLSDGPLRLLERDTPWRLTPRGQAVMSGEERHRPPPRFLAGVTIRPDPAWLWDPRATGVHKAA